MYSDNILKPYLRFQLSLFVNWTIACNADFTASFLVNRSDHFQGPYLSCWLANQWEPFPIDQQLVHFRLPPHLVLTAKSLYFSFPIISSGQLFFQWSVYQLSTTLNVLLLGNKFSSFRDPAYTLKITVHYNVAS